MDTASVFVLIGDCEVKITDPCFCLDNQTISGNGQFGDIITISTTFDNDTWQLVYNEGMYQTSSPEPPAQPIFISLGTTFTPTGRDGKFYTHTLDIKHIDGIGFYGIFTNGRDTLDATNICLYEQSCNDITISTDPTGTPVPPVSSCILINNVSRTKTETFLEDCNACLYRTDDAHSLYADTIVRNNVHTICPSNPWQRVRINYSVFDLAVGDTLFVYEGRDTFGALLGKYSGVGVGQTGGWHQASCAPSINNKGCLTFNFKTKW